jgi:hypothetical protein
MTKFVPWAAGRWGNAETVTEFEEPRLDGDGQWTVNVTFANSETERGVGFDMEMKAWRLFRAFTGHEKVGQ